MSKLTQSGLTPAAVEKRKEEAEAALKRMVENQRISKIVVVVPADACQVCQSVAGTYEKDAVPELPFDLCSDSLGCRAKYQPYIYDLYP